MDALTRTDYNFPGQTGVYHGKVRDVYSIGNETLVMIATDRISAFDVVLPKGIPYKGQVLNQTAGFFLDATADVAPNWKLSEPDPMVTAGQYCRPFPVEMVVRGYLAVGERNRSRARAQRQRTCDRTSYSGVSGSRALVGPGPTALSGSPRSS